MDCIALRLTPDRAGTAPGIIEAWVTGALKALVPITVSADEVIAAEVRTRTMIDSPDSLILVVLIPLLWLFCWS